MVVSNNSRSINQQNIIFTQVYQILYILDLKGDTWVYIILVMYCQLGISENQNNIKNGAVTTIILQCHVLEGLNKYTKIEII